MSILVIDKELERHPIKDDKLLLEWKKEKHTPKDLGRIKGNC